jgi:hypothetical protein
VRTKKIRASRADFLELQPKMPMAGIQLRQASTPNSRWNSPPDELRLHRAIVRLQGSASPGVGGGRAAASPFFE